jgi:hypothetical protein
LHAAIGSRTVPVRALHAAIGSRPRRCGHCTRRSAADRAGAGIARGDRQPTAPVRALHAAIGSRTAPVRALHAAIGSRTVPVRNLMHLCSILWRFHGEKLNVMHFYSI